MWVYFNLYALDCFYFFYKITLKYVLASVLIIPKHPVLEHFFVQKNHLNHVIAIVFKSGRVKSRDGELHMYFKFWWTVDGLGLNRS